MNWNKLESLQQLEAIKEQSESKTIYIFKHSTRCSISSMALNRLERNWKEDDFQEAEFYYLDLIANRELSDRVAEDFGVDHQSPQVIAIKNRHVVYDASHMAIDYRELVAKQ